VFFHHGDQGRHNNATDASSSAAVNIVHFPAMGRDGHRLNGF
jgi:hypothetical protein